MTNDAKEYYKGGRRVLIGGVPCKIRDDNMVADGMEILLENSTLGKRSTPGIKGQFRQER